MTTRRLACRMLILGLPASLLAAPAAPAAGATPMLQGLAGDYHDGRQHLRLHADGRFEWRATLLPGGTDAGVDVRASGRVRRDEHTLRLDADARSLATADGRPTPAQALDRLPARLYAVQVKASDLTVLLDDAAINMIANQANGFGRVPIDVSAFLHRRQPGGDRGGPLPVAADALMPGPFMQRLLAAPLRGRVVAIEATGARQENVAGWMQPPVWRTQHSAQLTIDLGSSHGVFEGMRLYVGARRQAATVGQVLTDRCQAQMVWIDDAPLTGDPVSSALH